MVKMMMMMMIMKNDDDGDDYDEYDDDDGEKYIYLASISFTRVLIWFYITYTTWEIVLVRWYFLPEMIIILFLPW